MSSSRSVKTMLTGCSVWLFLAQTAASPGFASNFAMQVTEKNYLDTQGFSVFLYDSTYHPVFVDQKNTAMEMILHGQRIATNGDVRLHLIAQQRSDVDWTPLRLVADAFMRCRQASAPAFED